MSAPGAWQFVIAGFLGRIPIGMLSIGLLLLITTNGGTYTEGGIIVGLFAVTQALCSPMLLRWVDRAGQRQTLPWLVAGESLGLFVIMYIVTVSAAAFPLVCALAAITGAVSPHVGSLVRARWSVALHTNRQHLSTAFSLESALDQLIFVLGPLMVVSLTVTVNAVAALCTLILFLLAGSLWLATQTDTQPPPTGTPTAHQQKNALWNTSFLLLLLIAAAVGLVVSSLEFTVIAVNSTWGTDSQAGVILAVFAGASFIAGLLVGAATFPAAHPQRFLIITTLMLAVISSLPAMFTTSTLTLFIFAVLTGFTVAPVLIVTTTLVERYAPPSRLTEALGLTISGIALGFAVGGTAAGTVIDHVSPPAGFLVTMTAGLLAVIFAVIYLSAQQLPTATPSEQAAKRNLPTH